jgi:TRAP-type C4-dicarboxylate transport system substrate-binding protein
MVQDDQRELCIKFEIDAKLLDVADNVQQLRSSRSRAWWSRTNFFSHYLDRIELMDSVRPFQSVEHESRIVKERVLLAHNITIGPR